MNTSPKIVKRSVESSAVHWLKRKKEDKEGLLVHVRTCKDTQPKRVPNSAGYMVSDLLEICIGPYMFVQLRKQQFMEGTYAIAVL